MPVSGNTVVATPENHMRPYAEYARIAGPAWAPAAVIRTKTDDLAESYMAFGRKGFMQRVPTDGSENDQSSETLTSGSPRVLVIDAITDSALSLAKALKDAGIVALIEPDRARAFDRVRALQPNLIVMDVPHSGREGFDLAARLQKDPALQHIPVIFRTDRMETENVLLGLEVGGLDYIAKGRPLSEIVARIRTHLRVAHVAQTMRLALDASNRPTIGVKPDGSLLWCTPAAADLLSGLFVTWQPNTPLPPVLRNVLEELILQGSPDGRKTVQLSQTDGVQNEGIELECILAGLTDDGAMGVTLLSRSRSDEERRLAVRHNLTTREAQVLFWIGRGKSNRDISEILGISARTVNKHLEQIFVKLGVENRASAAAIVVKTSSE